MILTMIRSRILLINYKLLLIQNYRIRYRIS
nr:MAG TPA: hypothetical protein [Caudoviricetes sp.]